MADEFDLPAAPPDGYMYFGLWYLLESFLSLPVSIMAAIVSYRMENSFFGICEVKCL